MMATTAVDEGEDWRQCSIFWIPVLCGVEVCDLIIDGGSLKNIISKYTVEKSKLPTEQYPHPYKIRWLKKRMGSWLHLFAWLNLLRVVIWLMRPCVTLCLWMLVIFFGQTLVI